MEGEGDQTRPKIKANQNRGPHQTLKLSLKVRFHHHIFPTNLMTNLLTKSPYKQMSLIFVLFVSQKFVANQIGLLQTNKGNFASKFVIKFVAKM
jgi:hypothetical protein